MNKNTYISFLRGINVGGHKIIKMEALRNRYTDLGFTAVKSYIQSGNVVFETENELEINEVEKLIEDEIAATFGFEVPVLVKKAEQMMQILAQNPFLKDDSKLDIYFHVTFLSAEPKAEIISELKNGAYKNDDFQCLGDCIYLYCPDSYSQSKLSNSFFESKLKCKASTRNWKTLIEISKLIS